MSVTVSQDDIRKNYSKVGTGLIEQLYGDDFLSLSGVESSDAMIAAAQVGPETHVLDVGCGVGGPALYLAEKTGCRVTGIDLVEWHAEESASRAAQKGLSGNTRFQAGDATELAFKDQSFDVVWSQDAWCHVPDKKKTVSEAARVVKSGGYVAFTDWVALGQMEPEYLDAVQSAVASPNFGTVPDYENWMVGEGLRIVDSVDISGHFTARYRTMIQNLRRDEAKISAQFSPRVFGIMLEKNAMILRAFEDGLLGGWRFVALKP